ncbi:MAG: dihydropteroate synthase [Sulfobacillus benefaciens]|uniref:Dihydropteroate synthase n=1 Tax=Sulfobacillus benefaciens TaxID=453960 RepID=A0A2T2XD79_9FIRM|nr:MAG: dihydropteroate synthase [Sulfobacillus benefaciens]
MTERIFHFNGQHWCLGQRTYIMGILNVTPDSFSDGGRYRFPDTALRHAETLISGGADMVDIGGESTRPGHVPVAADEEWQRIYPVLREMKRRWPEIPLSVDTQKATVAKWAIAEGADVINDIQGAIADPEMISVVANSSAGYVLMFNRATPFSPGQVDVDEMVQSLKKQVAQAAALGLTGDRILIDPGVGFAYGVEDNWTVLKRLSMFSGIAAGVLVGPSRKRFLGAVTGALPQNRDWATAAVSSIAVGQGMDVVRVHEVSGIRQALLAADRWWRHE